MKKGGLIIGDKPELKGKCFFYNFTSVAACYIYDLFFIFLLLPWQGIIHQYHYRCCQSPAEIQERRYFIHVISLSCLFNSLESGHQLETDPIY